MSISVDRSEREKFEKIANLMLSGVNATHIAAACNLTPGRISQIQDDPEFIQIYELKANEKIAEQSILDEGWDAIERQAMTTVLKVLQKTSDPDFALKSAVLANKAQRRRPSHPQNRTLNPGDLGARVVINLPVAYINQINAPRSVSSSDGNGNGNIPPQSPPSGNGQNRNGAADKSAEVVDLAHVRENQIDIMTPKEVNNLFDGTQTDAQLLDTVRRAFGNILP